MKIISIFGTRPEAIKMAPIIKTLEQHPEVDAKVWVTGQHREMLDQMLGFFEITPDIDLDLMVPNQTLEQLTANIISRIGPMLATEQPDWVLVQGDTTSAMATALAAFYHKIPVAHVEAGLRTGDIYSPWPEEANRQIIGRLAQLHLAPTSISASNLTTESTPASSVETTGNTVIDALFMVLDKLKSTPELSAQFTEKFSFIDASKKLILVTGHRRENWTGGLQAMCNALKHLSKRDDIEIVYPVHLNPNVKRAANEILADNKNIHLIPPVDYVPFVYLMQQAHLIITDSGGIQEEAPSLGIPVLVTRESTERPEGITAGTCKLVKVTTESIYAAASELLDNQQLYAAMSKATNPYGDGHSAERIVKKLLRN